MNLSPEQLAEIARRTGEQMRAAGFNVTVTVGSPPPLLVVPAGKEWAYDQMGDTYRSGRLDWIEVSEGFYQQALEVLPPIMRPGGFLVSEAWIHDEEGMPVYAGFTRQAGRHFARYSTVAAFPAQVKNLVAELIRLRAVTAWQETQGRLDLGDG